MIQPALEGIYEVMRQFVLKIQGLVYKQDVSLCPYGVVLSNCCGDDGNPIFFTKGIKEWGNQYCLIVVVEYK
jgi:hypothetical protein